MCQICKIELFKKPKETWGDFGKRKFCSYECYWKSKKGSIYPWLNKGGGYHKGHRHSIDAKIIMSAKKQGIPTEKWIGFTDSSLSEKARHSTEYKQWRKQVLSRDNKKCVLCNKTEKVMHVDHIKPFSIYKESRFDVSNGRTLCVNCHKNTPTWGGNIFSFRKNFPNTGF